MGSGLIPPENSYPSDEQYRAIICALVHMLGGSVMIDYVDLEEGNRRAVRMIRYQDPFAIRLETMD